MFPLDLYLMIIYCSMIPCVMSVFVGEVDYKEIGDCVHVSGYSSTDLCLPALDYLRKCSQV